jgi:PAS domain S-box-containing protein
MKIIGPVRPRGYAVAAAVTALAVLLRWVLDPWAADIAPFITMFGAVALSIHFGGRGAAILCATVGYLICDYLFVPPRGAFGHFDVAHLFILGQYSVSCALIIGFGAAVRQGKRRLDGVRERLRVSAQQQHLAEAGRIEMEQRFRRMGETAPVLMWMSGPDQRCTWFNQRWLDFVGRALDAELGDRWVQGVHPDDAAARLQTYTSAFDERRTFSIEYRLRRHDGAYRWLHDTGTPLYDAEGHFAGYIGCCIDIHDRKQAEDALRLSEQRFQAFMLHTPAATSIKDRDGRYVYVNRLSQDRARRPLAEWLGKTDFELFPESAAKQYRNNDLAVLASGKAERFVERGEGADGIRYYLALKFPLQDFNGETLLATIAVDVTEQRRTEEALRQSEERFRSLAESIAQLAWMAKPDGYIYWYNRRWFEYTGTTQGDVEGWAWQSVHHPDTLPDVMAHWHAALAAGSTFEKVFPLRGADGTYRSFLTRCVPLRDADGTIVQWFGTNTDISEQLALQEQLRDADRRKDEFLATLAHELRNPLAPLRSGVEILRHTTDPGRIRETRDMMERQLTHMARLLDDLLDVARITAGKLELRRQSIDVSAVLRSALESVQPAMDSLQHTVTLTPPPKPIHVDGDAVRLAQVFSNLFNNAAKYTPRGGHISISVRPLNDEVEVAVRDNGTGIAPELLLHIFDMFSQARPALDRAQGGLGIGLSLSRAIVEMHGGSITAHSAGPGLGSEFRVRLPTAAAPQAEIPADRADVLSAVVPEPGAARGRRILIADDNVDAAESLAMILQLAGYDVQTVHDGEQAVAAAKAFRPEIALLDIGMPKLNGYEACQRIRTIPECTGTTLIALTGWGQKEDRQRSEAAGFNAHLVKPVDPDALVRVLAFVA